MNERPVGAGCAKVLTRQSYQPAPRPPKGVTPWPTQLRPWGIPMLHSLPGVSQRDRDRCGDPFLHWPQQPSCSLQTSREEVLLLQLQTAERDSQQVQDIPEV